jgi:MFS family permease
MNSQLELATLERERTAKISALLWITFVICFLSNIFAGLFSTLMSVYLPVVVRTLSGTVSNEELNTISAYINSLYLVGWAIGGFCWGWIADSIGRSRSLILSVGSFGFFTFIISTSTSWESVVAFRLLSGFAVGGILVLTPTLLSEIWPQKTRSVILGIDSIGFPIGIFSSGLVNYLLSDWRSAFILGAIPIALAIVSIWLLKESQNWHSAKSKVSKRLSTLTSENRSNLIKGSIIFSSMLIGLWGLFSWIPTWVQSLLHDSDGQSERGVTMMLLGAGGLTGGFISGWISNAVGVRKAMMICFAGCITMSFLLFAINDSFSKIIYLETALLSMFFGISQGLLSIYITQLFPFHIRGTATGFCFNIGRPVTAAAVFSVGTLVTTLGGYSNALLSFAAIFMAGFVTIFLTKEIPV